MLRHHWRRAPEASLISLIRTLSPSSDLRTCSRPPPSFCKFQSSIASSSSSFSPSIHSHQSGKDTKDTRRPKANKRYFSRGGIQILPERSSIITHHEKKVLGPSLFRDSTSDAVNPPKRRGDAISYRHGFAQPAAQQEKAAQDR